MSLRESTKWLQAVVNCEEAPTAARELAQHWLTTQEPPPTRHAMPDLTTSYLDHLSSVSRALASSTTGLSVLATKFHIASSHRCATCPTFSRPSAPPAAAASATGPTTSNNLKERARMVILGLASGDSLGSTSEFMIPWQVPKNCIDPFIGRWPEGLVAANNWDQGEPTDDTDMAMCLARAVTKEGKFDPVKAGKEFIAWMNSKPKDMGMTTRIAIGLLAKNPTEYWFGGLDCFSRCGRGGAANGSLMRNASLAAILTALGASEKDLIEATVQQSIITHFGPLPVLTCVLQSLLIHRAMKTPTAQRRPPTLSDLEAILKGPWFQWKTHPQTADEGCKVWLRETSLNNELGLAEVKVLQELAGWEDFDPYHHFYKGISGYCVLSLKIALWALHWAVLQRPPSCGIPGWLPSWLFVDSGLNSGGIEAPLRWVVAIGADADTYGAIAGGLLAAFFPAIPQEWSSCLKVLPEVNKILDDLLPNN